MNHRQLSQLYNSRNNSRIARSLHVVSQPIIMVMALMFLVISAASCGGSNKSYKIPVDAPQLKPFEPPADEEFDADDSGEWSEDDADEDDADEDDVDEDDADEAGASTEPPASTQPASPKAN